MLFPSLFFFPVPFLFSLYSTSLIKTRIFVRDKMSISRDSLNMIKSSNSFVPHTGDHFDGPTLPVRMSSSSSASITKPPLSSSPSMGSGGGANRWGLFCACTILLVLCLSSVALHLALQTFRPPVWLDSTPKSPSGYFYGGAVYQGSGIWITNKPVLPSARSDLVAVSAVDKIFLIGGQSSNQTVLNDVLEFDPVFERYNTTRKVMPVPRYRHAGAAINTLIYVVGGITVYDGTPLDTMDIYDILKDNWQSGVPMSIPRTDCAAAVLLGKLYVFGGYSTNYDMSVSGTLVEMFDPSTNSWTVRASMPTPRGDLAAVTFGTSRIFVMGGWNDRTNDFQTATEAYSPATNSWSTFANMITPKGDLAVAVYRNRIFNVGGEVWSGKTDRCPWDPTLQCNINEVPTHDTIAFDPNTDPASITERSGTNTAGSVAGANNAPGVWVPHAPNPGARFRFAGAVHEASQALWVFGGTKDQRQVVDTVSAFYDTDHPNVFIHYKA